MTLWDPCKPSHGPCFSSAFALPHYMDVIIELGSFLQIPLQRGAQGYHLPRLRFLILRVGLDYTYLRSLLQ